jgi:hypothetical protein
MDPLMEPVEVEAVVSLVEMFTLPATLAPAETEPKYIVGVEFCESNILNREKDLEYILPVFVTLNGALVYVLSPAAKANPPVFVPVDIITKLGLAPEYRYVGLIVNPPITPAED